MVQEWYGISERRACRALLQPRATQRYSVTIADDEEALTRALVQLASRYGRYGYRRVSALLRRDGWRVNHKRVDGSGGWKGSRSRPSSPSGDGSGLPTAPVCASGHNDRTTCGPTTLWLFVPVMADLFVSSRWWMSIPGNVWPSRLGVRYAHPTSLSAWETSWWSTVCRSISVQITALSSLPGLSVHGYREWGFRPDLPPIVVPQIMRH